MPSPRIALPRFAALATRWNKANPYLVDSGIATLVLAALSVQFVLPMNPEASRTSWWSFGLTALTAAPLVWRRRAPLTVLIACCIPMFANKWLDGVGQPLPYAGLAAVYTVAAISPRPQRVVMTLVALTTIPIGVLANSGTAREFLYTFATFFSAYILGRLTASRRVRTVALAERAAATERARIARDMHDILSHSVSLMIVQAEAGPVAVRGNPDRAERAFDAIAATGREAMTQLRRMLGVLSERGESAEQNRPQPTMNELPDLVAQLNGTGIRGRLAETGTPGALPADAQVAVYRIVQEALTNVVKHSGATEVVVRLEWRETLVRVRVTDDGTGPSGGTGNGLINMRERAVAHGASVHTGPAANGVGFHVTAEFPLRITEEAAS